MLIVDTDVLLAAAGRADPDHDACVRFDGDSLTFCRNLVTDHGLALAPGDTFGDGGAGAVRMSLAASEDDIASGLKILASVLST